MISKEELMKQFKRVFDSRSRLREHGIAHPDRDWVIALLVAGAIVFVSGGWGAKIYLAQKNSSPFDTMEETAIFVYRNELVKDAHAIFYKRAEISAQLLGMEASSSRPTIDEVTPTLATSTESVDNEQVVPAAIEGDSSTTTDLTNQNDSGLDALETEEESFELGE